MSKGKRRRTRNCLNIGLCCQSFWKSYDNVVVTNQCCHILLKPKHNDISFCAGSVVISLQKEHESCLRSTGLVFFPLFLDKVLSQKRYSRKDSPCSWKAKTVKSSDRCLTNSCKSGAWFPLKSIGIGCLRALTACTPACISGSAAWQCYWEEPQMDGINQHVLGSTSILMLVLPIVWRALVSPWTTISDEFADSSFFVTVKLSFPLTVAQSKDSLLSVSSFHILIPTSATDVLVYDVCCFSLFNLKRSSL